MSFVLLIASAALTIGYLLRQRVAPPPPADLVSPEERLKLSSAKDRECERKGGQAGMSIVKKIGGIFRPASDRQAEDAAPPISPAAPFPPVTINYEDDRIPDSAKTAVRRILACLQEVETAMAREQIPGFSRIDMEQMRDYHLPKLIKSYIDIPPAHRSEIFRKTGKSASFILAESLEKMQSHIDEILRNLAQHDIDAFTNNIQFIGQRYTNDDPFS